MKNKLYLYAIFLLASFLWLFSFLAKKDIFLGRHYKIIEDFSLLTLTFVISAVLILKKDINYIIAPVMFLPFTFAKGFDLYTVPTTLFISLGIIVLAIIMHIILFKPKFKFTKYSTGLLILGIAVILGGFSFTSNYFTKETVLISLCVLVLVILFIFISSNVSYNFDEFSLLMTCLGVFLVFQLGVYFLSSGDLVDALFTKKSNVGWGISNNIALILLFCSPFSLYFVIKKERPLLFFILMVIQFAGIVLTYSRGAIFSLALGLLVMVPVSIIKANKRIKVASFYIVTLFLCVGFVFLLRHLDPDKFKQFIDVATKINLKDLNGRIPIYSDTVDVLKESPIFGKGITSLYNDNNKYIWGHNTIIQTAKTIGSVGLICLLIHFIEKYFYLIKKCNIKKFIIILGLCLSDIYGMMDVSYYFINYMVVLIIVLALTSNLLKKDAELCLVKEE